jgi:hypothetical protein
MPKRHLKHISGSVSKIKCKKTPTKALETHTPKSGNYIIIKALPLEAFQGEGRFSPPGNTWPSEARGFG